MRAGIGRGAGRRVVRRIGPAVTLAALGLSTAPVAMADEPFAVTERITDRVGALDDRRSEVERAIDRLAAGHSADLYVVYVDDFSGLGREQWAAETAARSRLGVHQMLLAVATGEGVYELEVDEKYPLAADRLREISQVAITPAFAVSDWAGGAIGAADGLAATLSGAQVRSPELTPGDPDPGAAGSPWLPVAILGIGLLGMLGVFGVLVALGYAGARRRRVPGDDPSVLTIDELDTRADRMLVRTDDAIKTSEQDLEFARAERGDEAVIPFAAALDEAKRHLDGSFRLRGRIDDETPDDAAKRRAMLEEMMQLLAAANEVLDAQAPEFDGLRDVETNTSTVLDTVTAVATEARARLVQTRSSLEAMAERYAPSALEPVAANGDQAADLLDFAGSATARAREKSAAGDRAAAVVAALAAQGAAAQADHLMEAVDRLAADLAEASRSLTDAVKQAAQDLADVKELLAGGPQERSTAGQVAAAEHALAGVQRELASGAVDPIDAIKRIEQADLSIDGALERVRDVDARMARAEARLELSMLAARAEISAATDYITTRRGGVGAEARTRLAEARRRLSDAEERATDDPIAALKPAHHAHERASRAMRLARSDVGAFDPDAVGVLGEGGFAGAMLGGILVDTGSGGPAGSSGGGRGPGGFGGIGTMSRRGGY